jgi:hypothetical protein
LAASGENVNSQQFWQVAISSAVVGAIPVVRDLLRESRAKRSREGRNTFSYELAHRLGKRWAAHKQRLRRPLA